MEAGDGVSHLTGAGNPYADALHCQPRNALILMTSVFFSGAEPVLLLAIPMLHG